MYLLSLQYFILQIQFKKIMIIISEIINIIKVGNVQTKTILLNFQVLTF